MIGREKKEQIIAQLHDRLMTAQAVIICRNTGLTAIQMADLRHRLRDCDAAAKWLKTPWLKFPWPIRRCPFV